MKKNKPFSPQRQISDKGPQRSKGKPFSQNRKKPDQRSKDLNDKPFTYYKKKEGESEELKYYGFHACLNLWKSRPDDIIRVYVDESRVKEASPLLKWCASKAKAYKIVSSDEMLKVSDSVHHEGLCVLAREPKELKFNEMVEALKLNKDPACLIYIDGVQNPHNIGSIMRVSAHFGIKYIIGQKGLLPKVSPSAYRIAQGGAEHVKLVAIDDIKQSFQKLEQIGFKIVASSSHGGHSLYRYHFQPRTVIVLGSESEGVNRKLLESTKDTLLIPGSGLVESLNVSVATGLFLGEYFRQVESKK